MPVKNRLRPFIDRINKMGYFNKFLLSYLLILITPLFLTSIAYNQAVHIIKDDATNSRLFMLKHIQNSLDQFLKETEDNVINLALDSELRSVYSYPRPDTGSSDYYWFYKYLNTIKTFHTDSGTFRSEMYIFCNKSEAVFSTSQVDFGFESFYAQNLSFDNISFSDWKKEFLNRNHFRMYLPSTNVTINGEAKTAIPYIVSVPLNKNSVPSGTILCLIDEEYIRDLLKQVNMGDVGWTYIVDSNGQKISESNAADIPGLEEIDTKELSDHGGYFIQPTGDGDVLCVYEKSELNNWTYVTVAPLSAVMGQAYYLRQTFFLVAFLALLLGGVVSVYLTYRNTKPFKTATQALKNFIGYDASGGKRISEDEYLQKGIVSLINDNIDIQSHMKSQNSILKNMFWERLLTGGFDEKSKMDALMRHIELDFEGGMFIAVIIKITRHDELVSPVILEELDVLRISIEEILRTQVKEKSYLHILNENEVALLLSFEEKTDKYLKSRVESVLGIINREIFEHFHVFPIFGIGNYRESFSNLYLSFNEAKQALSSADEQQLDSETIFWYNQIQTKNPQYFYPREMEDKIINCTRVGRLKEISEILQLIYQSNYVQNSLSGNMSKLLLNDMSATIVKILSTSNTEAANLDIDFPLLAKKAPEQFFVSIEEIYGSLCSTMSNIKKEHNSKLKSSILGFIDDNISNSSLCLNLVASNFNLSESYFSQLFKEFTGMNFSTYVENARINLACNLIKEKNLSFDKIATMAGYNNTHTFRRAFKKVKGIVPSDYAATH